jgi:hypothetical protein
MRFHGPDTTSRANRHRCCERNIPNVCADIDNRVTGFQISPKKLKRIIPTPAVQPQLFREIRPMEPYAITSLLDRQEATQAAYREASPHKESNWPRVCS